MLGQIVMQLGQVQVAVQQLGLVQAVQQQGQLLAVQQLGQWACLAGGTFGEMPCP
jgi:hypothetical protein